MVNKQSGIGSRFFVDGYDISGDIGAISTMSSTVGEQNSTGLPSPAMERIMLLEDGEIGFNNFYNPNSDLMAGAIGAHEVLKLPHVATRQGLYFQRPSYASLVCMASAKQTAYNLARAADGSMLGTCTLKISEGLPLEWGVALTDGKHHAVATAHLTPVFGRRVGGSVEGLSACAQIFAIVGGAGNDVTIVLQHSDYSVDVVTGDDDAFLLVTNLLNNHAYGAPNGAGNVQIPGEAVQVSITIVDTTGSIVAGTVRIVGTDRYGNALTEDISIAAGAGVHNSTHRFKTVTAITTLNDVTVLGGSGDETIKVGIHGVTGQFSNITNGAFPNVDISAAPVAMSLQVAGTIKAYARVSIETVSGFTTADITVAAKWLYPSGTSI